MNSLSIDSDHQEYVTPRVQPHSVEAESAVLGGMLLGNKTSYEGVTDVLVEDDFYRHEHRLIFAACVKLINEMKPIDVITVHDALQRAGQAGVTRGLAYLVVLAQQFSKIDNLRHHAQIVREQSVLRKLLAACDEIATLALDPQGSAVSRILDEAEIKISSVWKKSTRMRPSLQRMDKLAQKLLKRVEDLSENPSDVTGVSTGFCELDRVTAGLQAGQLIVIAGRPSMGKTALGLNIAEHVALNERLPVAFFSIEASAEQLTARIAGSLGRIDLSRLRTGKLQDEEWPRFNEVLESLRHLDLHIDGAVSLTPSELRTKALQLVLQRGKLGLVVVDHLQLMTSAGFGPQNRADELDEIACELKDLAMELDCPLIVLSQLNRGVEGRADKRPMLRDLRGSGAIEEIADLIMFIYRLLQQAFAGARHC